MLSFAILSSVIYSFYSIYSIYSIYPLLFFSVLFCSIPFYSVYAKYLATMVMMKLQMKSQMHITEDGSFNGTSTEGRGYKIEKIQGIQRSWSLPIPR